MLELWLAFEFWICGSSVLDFGTPISIRSQHTLLQRLPVHDLREDLVSKGSRKERFFMRELEVQGVWTANRHQIW